jgi:isopentenyl-diphosphate delta-isomerase
MNDLLILVDEDDNEIGLMEKLAVHQTGSLHRAFSVFIFNSKGELLLQQRADDKYHSGGLWTNTCCSHPVNGEEIKSTIKKRLKEEMGLDCETNFQFSFIYKTGFGNGLTEHELDHVYFGKSDAEPMLNTFEAKDWKYISLENLEKAIQKNPENYTTWLRICLPEVIKKVEEEKQD